MAVPNIAETTSTEATESQPVDSTGATETPSNDTPSTDDSSSSGGGENEEFRILQTYAQNASRQNQLLQQQLHEMRQQLENVSTRVTQTTERERPPIVTDDDFRESPAAAMDRLFDAKLEEKLNRTIAPLIEAQRAQQRESVFNSTFSTTLASMAPQVAPYAEQLAPLVKQIIGNADPTPQAIQMATLMAIGQYALQGPQNSPAPANAPSSRPAVPASAPSSAPRNRPAVPKLNESQLRAFNRLGYKPGQEQEFLDMLNADEVRF